MVDMEPTLESEQAFHALAHDDLDHLRQRLLEAAEHVRIVVPQCWGLSLTMVGQEDVTFTLVASSQQVADLDAIQYLDDGPCEQTAREGTVTRVDDLQDSTSEERWHQFATIGAAAGVLSTLSVPLRIQGRVVGGVNLYASQPQAFAGHEDEVAAIFGSLGSDVVANADMAFASRQRSVRTKEWLDEQHSISVATGITMARFDLDTDEARDRLADAAARAGISEARLAAAIIGSLVERQA